MQHRSALPPLAAVALGYALITGSHGVGTMLADAGDAKTLPSILAAVVGSPGLVVDILHFAFFFLATHLAVACVWHLCWLAIDRRFLASDPRRRSLAVLGFLPVLLWITLTSATRHPTAATAIDMGNAGLLQALWLATTIYIVAIPLLAGALKIGALYRRPQANGVNGAAARATRLATAALGTAIVLGTTFALTVPGDDDPVEAREDDRPDILLIGVDSVRTDHLGVLADSTESLTPAMDGLLAEAAIFDNAWTPFGRTFPTWISILTGAHPPNHGGIFNLIDRGRVDAADSLTSWLADLGYHRMYAIDETRFSNLDESYGFDQIVSPHIGALDFLLGGIGETPLVNLIANTSIGRHLFPAVHGNRGIGGAYRPATFDRTLGRMINAVDPGDPLFLAVHYELPHWPYDWAYSNRFEVELPQRLKVVSPKPYQRTVARVDQQVDALLQSLRRAGRLENAIVILLSDHGEAFPPSEPEWQYQGQLGASIPNHFGHGTNVISPAQYRAILGIRGFGPQRQRVEPRRHRDITASLSDIEATLGDWLGVPADQRRPRDGLSLLPAIAEGRTPFPEPRVVPLETGFSHRSLELGDPDEAELIAQAGQYYRITPEGRLVLKERLLPELLRQKQRGVASGDWLLGAYPHDADAGEWELILANHQTHNSWNARDPDLPDAAPSAAMLAGLCQWFGHDPTFTLPECSALPSSREHDGAR